MSAVRKKCIWQRTKGTQETCIAWEREYSWTQVQHIRVGQEITQEGQQVKDFRRCEHI